MNWYYMVCLLIVFYSGYKIGQTIILFNLAVKMNELKISDQTEFRRILKIMGVKDDK